MSWSMVAVGEIAEVKGGGTPSKSRPDFYEGDIPWVTPKDMKFWEIVTSIDKITEEAVAKSATNLVPANSVLLVNRSGILKHTLPVGIAQRPVAINQDIKALIFSDRCDARYAAQIIKASERIVLGWVRATTADNFPIQNLKDMPIPLPPLEEQRRIAGVLDAADALRRRRREALALVDTLPGAIFAEMFLSPLASGSERGTHPLGSLVDSVSGSTPSKSNKAFWTGEIPWISPKDMKSDSLDGAQLAISREAIRSGKAKIVGPDVSLIVVRGMILAHSVPVCDLRVTASFNQDVKALIPKNGISNIFVSAALRASKERLLSMVSNAAHGTKRIEMSDLMKFPVPRATDAEQQKFLSRMQVVAAQRRRYLDSLKDAEVLFASLQARAFAGEL